MNFSDFDRLTSVESKALNLGNKSIAYPNYNQAVILAGGSGSGKGFILNNVLSIRGKVFDTDQLKIKIPKVMNDDIKSLFEEQYGYRITDRDLSDPHHVSNLHVFLKELGYEKRIYETFFKANMLSEYKPNVIFDTTFASLDKARLLSRWLDFGGYKRYNRHLVWVLNDIEVAIQQNSTRTRSVSYKILLNTHTNSSLTIKELMQENNRRYFDGDVYIVFNRLKDTVVDKHLLKDLYSNDINSYAYELKKYTAFQLKQAGKNWLPIEEIEAQVLEKINQYTPKAAQWSF